MTQTIHETSVRHRVIGCATILVVLSLAAYDALGQSQDQLDPSCGILRPVGQYGPFDYRTAPEEQRRLVEVPHFNQEYAAFLLGKWNFDSEYYKNIAVESGLDYTLRAFPNHHRALKAMDEMGARRKLEQLPRARYTVECWFLRAIAFVPNDGLVRALYGAYLARRGRVEAAREQLREAIKLSPDDLNVRSHVAFAYIEIGDWADAEKHARIAYRYGYELPGLRDRLKAKGHWSE